MNRYAFLAAVLVAALSPACAAEPSLDDGAAESASALGRPVGGDTGAFLREVTPAGYGCIATTFVLPDYSSADPADGTPWVYFGVSDDRGRDAEVGFSFQHGDGTARLPRRWRPYMRRGKSFYYADEAESVRPGEKVSLLARLVRDDVYVKRDGRPMAFRGEGTNVNGLTLSGIDPARARFRRVIGQAVNGTYDGRRLAPLGPVVMTDAQVCAPDGKLVDFTYTAAGGPGSTMWPVDAVSRKTRQGTDEVWLFR